MDLSNPKLRKILIGVAVFVVIVFIVIRFFRRSNYSYPNASEEGIFSITAVPTLTAAAGATPPLATFTTTTPHGFSAGDLVYISGVTGLTYPEAATGLPVGSSSLSGGSAVYVYSIPQGSTTQFAVKATQTTAGTAPTVASATVKNIAQPAMNQMQNVDLLTCQTQYATDLVTATSTLTTSASQSIIGTSGGNKTVNVNSTTGFAAGDKVLIPGVVESAGKSAVLVIDTVAPGSLTFTAASVPATAQTILPQTAVSNITTAYAKRTACIQQTASTYAVGHCRYLPQASTNRPVVPLPGDDPVAYAAYQAYQTNIQAITTAYAAPISRATQNASFPTGGTVAGTALPQDKQLAIVEAARKADLANATQKYLASVCPGFYAQTSGSTVTDPSNNYKAWSMAASQADATAATSTAKKFWSGGVTDASIMAWAQGAGIVTLSGPVLSVTIPGAGIGTGYTSAPNVTFSAPPAGGTTASGTATVSNGKITGVTIASNGGGSGYTTNPTITFSGGGGTTTANDLGLIVVQISTSLSSTAPLVPAATAGFTPTNGSQIPYTANKYSAGTGDNINWRVAYKNGPGTYPKVTYV